MILIESTTNKLNHLVEDVEGAKKLYLSGIFGEAETKNQNQRIYDLGEMKGASQMINDRQKLGHHILGHLDHPDHLQIKLEDVSHKFVESYMEGNKMMCKVEILTTTPKGAIAQGLIEAGVNIGVSTRGSGQVNESTGRVSNFEFKTADLVAEPSCRIAFPTTLREQLEYYANYNELDKLAEAIQHDQAAQKYFATEIRKFIESVVIR